jgi:hypothetical protein
MTSLVVVCAHILLPLKEGTVRKHIGRLREKMRIDIVPKRFRKDFACRIEQAEADPSLIDLRQVRGQSGVVYKNYLKYPDIGT